MELIKLAAAAIMVNKLSPTSAKSPASSQKPRNTRIFNQSDSPWGRFLTLLQMPGLFRRTLSPEYIAFNRWY